MKRAFLFVLLLSTFLLFGCNKKTSTKEEITKATVAMIYINYDNIYDNKENLDVIDEGCKFAKVDKWFIVCDANKEQTFSVTVNEGYYIEGYTLVQEYSIKNAKFSKANSDNSVTVTPKPSQNYLVFDIRKIEE